MILLDGYMPLGFILKKIIFISNYFIVTVICWQIKFMSPNYVNYKLLYLNFIVL